jgi:NAD-dependent dihydropyrimidine dehydrogenase PreA subunit
VINTFNQDKCDGCGVCADNCPVEILRVKDGMIEMSEPEMFTNCGICFEVRPHQVFEAQ